MASGYELAGRLVTNRVIGEHPDVLDWPRDFWRRSRELVPCRIHLNREERQVTEEDGPLDPEPLMRLSEMRALLDALDDLGDYLRSEQIAFLKDPSSDEPNVVLLGLHVCTAFYMRFWNAPRLGRQTSRIPYSAARARASSQPKEVPASWT